MDGGNRSAYTYGRTTDAILPTQHKRQRKPQRTVRPFRLMSRTMVLASPSASVATPLAVDAMPRTFSKMDVLCE